VCEKGPIVVKIKSRKIKVPVVGMLTTFMSGERDGKYDPLC
jgi:hypothetical protein